MSWGEFRDRFERNSRVLNYYARQIGLQRGQRDPRQQTVQLPKTFSFIEDPISALDAITSFVIAARHEARKIFVDQSRCEHVDICAGTLLNVLALDAALRLGTRYAGTWPDPRRPAGLEALEILIATGLPHHLGIPLPKVPTFHTFDLRHGGTERRSLLVSSDKERAGDALVDYLSRAYSGAGHPLSSEHMNRLGRLVGEVLDNAQRHGAGSGWWITGYLRRPPNKPYGDLHITIMNFGDSLAETLQTMPPGEAREPLEDLVEYHRAQHLFDTEWTEEGLWTVLALQEGVTRFSEQGKRVSHGVGTAEMIEALQHLGRTSDLGVEPLMCLVSGHTQVLFHARHQLRRVQDPGGAERRVIAFNTANDLYLRPEPGTVRHLPRRFPGTLLSLRLYIDPRYLIQVLPRQ